MTEDSSSDFSTTPTWGACQEAVRSMKYVGYKHYETHSSKFTYQNDFINWNVKKYFMLLIENKYVSNNMIS